MFKSLRSFVDVLLRRKKFEGVMSEEIRFHIDTYVEDLVRSGVPLDEAKRRARVEFGGVDSVKEECRTSRRLHITDTLSRDLRFVWRTFLKNPAFTLTVVLTLALGIGSATAIFSVVYGVLLKPLPFPKAEQLVGVSQFLPARSLSTAFAEGNFWDMRDMNRTFDEFGAFRGTSFSLTGAGDPERVDGAQVSTGFFRALGATPVAGRLFVPGEDATGAVAERVMLSHRLWVRRFASNPNLVGQNVQLDGRAYEVVGILPPGTPWLDAADVFVPFIRRANLDRSSWEFVVVGRMKEGVSLESARTDLARIARDLEQYPPNKGTGVELQDSTVWVANPQLRQTLWILLGAVGFLLAVAAVNAANLLFALASSRSRENAMRTALGASRGDLVRQGLTQSLVLSVSGAVLGWFLSSGLLGLFRAMDPGGIPRLAEVRPNGWTALFAVTVALVVGLATGLVPALMSRTRDIAGTMREGQRGAFGDRRHHWVRGAFVCVEVAFALVLMIGAGLLVRSMLQVLDVDRGFQTPNRLMLRISIPRSYPPAKRNEVAASIQSQVEARPEVESVAAISGRPLGGGSTGLGFAVPGSTDSNVPWATWRAVTKDYFASMGLTLLSGRPFAESDQLGKPWRVIISKRVANMLWPGQNPVGRTMILWKGQGDNQAEVIGVVSDMRERGLENPPTLAVYFPAYGEYSPTTLNLVIHTRAAPQQFTPTLRAIVAGIDPTLPISDVTTLEEVVNGSVATRRFTMTLLFTFAAVALMLALAGVYGIVAYSVERRTAEVGVRLALGARPSRVLGLIVRQSMRPVGIGIILGLAGIVWLSRFMTALLFNVDAMDPLTYVASLFALAFIAVVACYLPARRVLRVDPAIALRIE